MASNTCYFKRSWNSCSWITFLSCDFTGCDIVPAFRRKGKKSAWQTWEVFPDATDVFTRLSKRHDTFAVNNDRLELFAKKQRSYDAIPPTLDALMEHTKRAVYQGGLVWGQTLECFQCLPWKLELAKRKRKRQLETKMDHFNSCRSCGCKKSNCVGNCKCYRSGLSCTGLCTCKCQIDWTHENIMM